MNKKKSNCKFCGKEIKSLGKSAHERLCKLNPNYEITSKKFKEERQNFFYKKEEQKTNGAIKAKKLGLQYKLSEETKNKLREINKGKKWSEERKNNHSKIMKNVVFNNPNSYSIGSIRGRSKKIKYKNTYFQSSWELLFFQFCEKNLIKINRCTKYFNYIYENTKRKYFPDFYLNEYDLYIEVKGYKTEKDLQKWKQFPYKLVIIENEHIKKIKKNEYTIEEFLEEIK